MKQNISITFAFKDGEYLTIKDVYSHDIISGDRMDVVSKSETTEGLQIHTIALTHLLWYKLDGIIAEANHDFDDEEEEENN